MLARIGSRRITERRCTIMAEQGHNLPDGRPRAEPEIIPPGAPLPRGGDGGFDARFTQRIYVARLGPFGMLLVALAVAVVAVVILLLVAGAMLIWIPLAALTIAAAVVSGLVRSRRRR